MAYKHSRITPLSIPAGRNGGEILNDPWYNKGTGFLTRERDRLGIRGLLPPAIFSMREQLARIYTSFSRIGDVVEQKTTADGLTETHIEQHLFLMGLQDRNETLFYRLVCDHIKEMAPIIYTPVVGYACTNAAQLFRRPRGLYLSGHEDTGDMHSIVGNWETDEVDVIVITDGSRILGLGDLGCHGMPISIGKLSLYVAAGGLHPTRCLPVMADMGTNNAGLLDDPMYLGVHKPRLEGAEYIQAMDEVMDALTKRYPRALIQFEDFKSPWAEFLLNRYRSTFCVFNDDVQGTGTMVLAGLLSALRVQGKDHTALPDQKIVCLGSGSAGIGVCNALVQGMVMEGLSEEEAHKRFYLVDVDGLLTADRPGLVGDQIKFARTDVDVNGNGKGMGLQQVIAMSKPTVLLGLCGVGSTFTEAAVREYAKHSDQPIMFPMSNPTSKAECTATQAYEWTEGRCIFASGSPFDPITTTDGTVKMYASQANNMFIFPGLGLGVTTCDAKTVSDGMLYVAAKTLVSAVREDKIKQKMVFPDVSEIREVSKQIAVAVCYQAAKEGLSRVELENTECETWEELVQDDMYFPDYQPLVKEKYDL